MVINYEDMLHNLEQEVNKIASFLATDLSQSKMTRILHEASLGAMRSREATNFKDKTYYKKDFNFIRQGKIGKWKQHFSECQNFLNVKIF